MIRRMTLVRFPPGDTVFAGKPFGPNIFAEVDRLLKQGHCPDGRLEMEVEGLCLTCLIHRSVPHLAGLIDGDSYAWIPLRYFPLRANQLEGAVCSLFSCDPVLILLAAIHFRHRPVLQASTELVDIEHVLTALAKEGEDAVLALQRSGTRTLLFLKKGRPTRLYFGLPSDDPREGDLRERFLLHAFKPSVGPGKLEVFKQLNIAPDPDAGSSLIKLAEASKPPPPMSILVRLGGRVVLQRPFMPPAMTIGRDLSCELLLDNLSVSRRHARLSWDRGHFIIEDLDSANGTTLNGKPISKHTMALTDRIGLGKFELSIIERVEGLHPDRTIIMSSQSSGGSGAYLVGTEVSVPLGQEISIGNAPGADVQARGMWVAPIHARIRPEGPGGAFLLMCLGNRKVKINGKKVNRSVVHFGDKIQVGRSRFTLVPSLTGESTNV